VSGDRSRSRVHAEDKSIERARRACVSFSRKYPYWQRDSHMSCFIDNDHLHPAIPNYQIQTRMSCKSWQRRTSPRNFARNQVRYGKPGKVTEFSGIGQGQRVHKVGRWKQNLFCANFVFILSIMEQDARKSPWMCRSQTVRTTERGVLTGSRRVPFRRLSDDTSAAT
jgi:hypothetical protein